MFKKLIGKVLHSLDHSKQGHGNHRHSSSDKGRRRISRSSSSGHSYKRHSSSDGRYSGGKYGHKHYKSKSGSSS